MARTSKSLGNDMAFSITGWGSMPGMVIISPGRKPRPDMPVLAVRIADSSSATVMKEVCGRYMRDSEVTLSPCFTGRENWPGISGAADVAGVSGVGEVL